MENKRLEKYFPTSRMQISHSFNEYNVKVTVAEMVAPDLV